MLFQRRLAQFIELNLRYMFVITYGWRKIKYSILFYSIQVSPHTVKAFQDIGSRTWYRYYTDHKGEKGDGNVGEPSLKPSQVGGLALVAPGELWGVANVEYAGMKG